MNNEEKILAILENHGEMLTEMRGDIAELKAGQAKLTQRVDDMDGLLRKTALVQEQEVLPQLKLLYENQCDILDKLIPTKRIEVLEEDVATLKTVVRILSDKVTELQKAQ